MATGTGPESEEDVAADGVSQSGAPHGITLFDHAQISAEIAEGNRFQADILQAHGLTESQWNEASLFWMNRIGEDVRVHGQDARIPLVYSDAFGKAQDALKLPLTMDAASYAKLVVDIQVAGGPTQPLAVRGLSLTRAGIAHLLAGELRTGMLIGAALGVIAFLPVMLVFGPRLAAAVATSIFIAGSVAAAIGIGLPWLLARRGLDPAYGSGPVATVIQDILTIVVYFLVLQAFGI